MGSCPFETIGYGSDAKAAYNNALEEALAENGHQDGYSGDIQTTEGFSMVEVPEGRSVEEMVEETIDDYSKWGPCGCIQLEDGKYVFFGWAAE